MNALSSEKRRLDWVELSFVAGMYWRILYGIFRLFVGYTLLKNVGTPAIVAFRHAMRYVIAKDPDDRILQLVTSALTTHGFSITYFIAAYMLFWGVVDIALSIALLRHLLWAFPVSLALIACFILYEVYRYSHTHSPVMLALICIDIFVMFLIRKEQRHLTARHALRTAAA